MQDVGQQYELKSGKNNKELTHTCIVDVRAYKYVCDSVCVWLSVRFVCHTVKSIFIKLYRTSYE